MYAYLDLYLCDQIKSYTEYIKKEKPYKIWRIHIHVKLGL